MANTQQAKRRAARRKDFQNQNIESASDFNFNQHGKNHVSQQEINHLRSRHKGGGGGFRDTYAALQKQKESGAEFSGRAQKQYDRMTERVGRLDARKAAKEKAKAAQGSSGQPTNPIDDTQTGNNDSVPSNEHMNHAAVMPGGGNPVTVGDNNSGTVGNNNAVVENNVENKQEQEVNQDNDIDTNVSGDDNTVINNQDNSVRQYGGDNRSFVYNSSGGAGSVYDSPVSAATMGGFYDVDDSPAAQAKFNDMYKDFNKDNGNRFAGEALATVGMFTKDARGYTPEAMNTAIGKSTQYSFDRADRQTGHVFGDIWNENYITENWKMPTPPKAIESNAEEIADKAKEDIEDV